MVAGVHQLRFKLISSMDRVKHAFVTKMKSSSQLHLPLSNDEVNIADMSLEDVVQYFPIMGEAKRVRLGIANKKQIQIYLYSK